MDFPPTSGALNMNDKRSKKFVNSPVQAAIVRRVFFHWGLFFTVAVLSLFSVEFFLSGSQESIGAHFETTLAKYSFFFMLVIAFIPPFVYDTIKFSNRFAGPMMRLQRSIKDLADGQTVAELKFRETDLWGELTDDFNRLAQRVQVVAPEEKE